MNDDPRQFFRSFERKGKSLVRIELPQGMYGAYGPEWAAAHEWLRLKDETRSSSRYLSTSRRARRAEIIAIIAAIIATLSMIKEIIVSLLK